MIREGDIVEIPLPDGRAAIGWILHISQHFKNAVGFCVFGIKGEIKTDLVCDLAVGRPLTMRILAPLYTHIDAITYYGWKTFAHQPISQSKLLLTTREVGGGGVYVGDEYIGSLEEVSDPDVKPMLAMGMPVVYSEIEKAFGKSK
jgi:hypothetical protein